MDQVPSHFARSLAMLERQGEVLLGWEVGSLIYHARNNLAKQAIQAEADRVLWLDSDMVFNPKLLTNLAALNVPFATALYCRRVPPFTPTLFKTLDVTDDGRAAWTEFDEIPDEPFKVAGCGFGGVLMTTDVILSIESKFGNCFAPVGNVGEDLAFCWRARQCGYDIICDPKIEMGHVGHTVITRSVWEGTKNADKG